MKEQYPFWQEVVAYLLALFFLCSLADCVIGIGLKVLHTAIDK